MIPPYLPLIPTADRISPVYAQYLTEHLEADWRSCPQCHGRRSVNEGHWRWVLCAPGQEAPLFLSHVRCRACGTIETVFPPWLLPYERLTVEMLESILTALLVQGQSVAAVAAAHQVSEEMVTSRWHRWRDELPAWHQQVEQTAVPWTAAPLVDMQTWHPPLTARSAAWAWLEVAWQALALLMGGEAPPSGWIFWRRVFPEVMPAGPIPARSHLGRRLRLPLLSLPP